LRISSELAQSTVDKLMAVLPFSCNIMDDRAVIVGSGDSTRLGTYHSAAAQILATGKPVEVRPDDATPPSGTKPGIGLPIMLHGRPVGVIGLSGDPAEVRRYAYVVRALTELALENEALRERMQLQEMVRKAFVSSLIAGTINEGDPWQERASACGLDMSLPRSVVVAEIDGYGSTAQDNIRLGKDPMDAERLNQRTKLVFYGHARAIFANPQDMTLELHPDRIVIIPCLSSTSLQDGGDSSQLTQVFAELQRRVKAEIGLTVTAGMSKPCLQLKDYSRAYHEALQALHIGKALYGRGATHTIDRLYPDILALDVAAGPNGHLLSIVIDALEDTPSGDVLFATIGEFTARGMNMKETARALHIHRNTLRYRLNQIHRLTGLSPNLPRDLLLLQLSHTARAYRRAADSTQRPLAKG